MQLYFRELTNDDIPQILEIIKDVWEGEDYISRIILEWLKDENSLNYGGFIDKKSTNLVGFGRVKIHANGVAWLQGGRVLTTLHRKGIGRSLMNYAIEYARKADAKVAQYDTDSNNLGALALAKHFGFKKKKSMHLLECKLERVKIPGRRVENVKILSLNDAKRMYHKLDIGPGNEVCIGWSFIPLDFLSEKNSTWIKKDEAILQKIKFKCPNIQQGPNENEVWMITYGNEVALRDLIEYAIFNELKIKDIDCLVIFCRPEIVKYVQNLGFSYWEEKPVKVILFEKEFS